jgi:hypothetical protein
MKTSTTLILTTAFVMLAGLITYNFNLKSSFLRGDYKNRFYGMEFTSCKDIRNVQVATANKLSVIIDQGAKEGIWIKTKQKDQIKWSSVGSMLKVDVNRAEGVEKARFSDDDVIIIAKSLEKITTESYFDSDEQEKFYSVYGETTINGFQQDSLEVVMDKFTKVSLNKLKLNRLDATVGDQLKGKAELVITSENIITNANFKIPGESFLNLLNPGFVKTHYQLSDKANVQLNGKLLKLYTVN